MVIMFKAVLEHQYDRRVTMKQIMDFMARFVKKNLPEERQDREADLLEELKEKSNYG